MISAASILSFPSAYIALQRAVGADRLRWLCIDMAGVVSSDLILDIGCGPAYYLCRLPPDVHYVGYDTSPQYIRYARRNYPSSNIDFRYGTFDPMEFRESAPFTAALLLGILHHLPDSACSELLTSVRSVLSDTGRVISVDTCFVPGQRVIARWVARADRGKFVRAPDQFRSLAGAAFEEVTGRVVSNATKVPGDYWLMCMRP